MKILVIDDNPFYTQAANAQLKAGGHEVMIARTYERGLRLIHGSNFESWGIGRESPVAFDAVLVDLLMPTSACGVGQSAEGNQLVGLEMPVGIYLALLAARHGAKYVGLLTDTDHHSSPVSQNLDPFNASELELSPFQVEGARVVLTNSRGLVGYFVAEDLSRRVCESEYLLDEMPDRVSVLDLFSEEERGDMGYGDLFDRAVSEERVKRAKDWKLLLDVLVEGVGIPNG